MSNEYELDIPRSALCQIRKMKYDTVHVCGTEVFRSPKCPTHENSTLPRLKIKIAVFLDYLFIFLLFLVDLTGCVSLSLIILVSVFA